MGVDAERDARVDTTAEPVVVSTPAFSAPPYRSDWRLLRSVEDLRLGKKRSAFIKAYRHAYVGRPNDGAVVEQVRVKEDIPFPSSYVVPVRDSVMCKDTTNGLWPQERRTIWSTLRRSSATTVQWFNAADARFHCRAVGNGRGASLVVSGVTSERLENAAPNCRTEKRGKRHVWKTKRL